MQAALSPSTWRAAWLPRPWKLGSIAAALVLVSLAVRLFQFPPRVWSLTVLGLVVSVPFTPAGLVALFLVLFTVSGVDWLFQDHPRYGRLPHLWLHTLLPTFTAWTLEMALLFTREPTRWWAMLVGGSLLLIGVLMAEYVALDPESPPFVAVQAGLTALGYLLFLMAAMYTRMAGWRLLWAAPTLTLMAGLVSLRLFALYTFGRFVWLETWMVTLLMGQAVLVMHVLALSPLGYGLALVLGLYVLHTVYRGLLEGHTLREALREPMWVALLLVGALLWLEWGR